jgi:hypothetical protein
MVVFCRLAAEQNGAGIATANNPVVLDFEQMRMLAINVGAAQFATLLTTRTLSNQTPQSGENILILNVRFHAHARATKINSDEILILRPAIEAVIESPGGQAGGKSGIRGSMGARFSGLMVVASRDVRVLFTGF